MKLKIIFEDKSLLVIDKPSGIIVDRSKTNKKETVQDWVEKYLKIEGKGAGDRAGIVHRLDKETSGVLLIAKDQETFEDLQDQFRKRKVKKTYLALVHGKVEPKKGTIEAPISRSPFNRKKFGVFLEGRQSKTKYKTEEYRKLNDKVVSLLELMPETGRTHQIRVHLKHIGYPIVADEKYGGRKRARADRQWCPRQFLHAVNLSFIHPQAGKRVAFYSPLPLDLKKALDNLY